MRLAILYLLLTVNLFGAGFNKWGQSWIISTWTAPGKTETHSGVFLASNVKRPALSNTVVLCLDQKVSGNTVLSYGAEIATKRQFQFGTFEFEADMPMGVSGTVSAGFLYAENSATEIDVEQQGNIPGRFDFSNWTSESFDDYFTSHAVGFSSGKHKFKIVWTAKNITWYVDGKRVAVHTEHIPTKPAKFMFNIWGTTSPYWGGTATPNTVRKMRITRFRYTK